MCEERFRKDLVNVLSNYFNDNLIKIEEKKSLLYNVIVNENMEFNPRDPKNPKRGNLAYETDILISDKSKSLPLVVIETKYEGFITHDVLVYSLKAQKHKNIYPYLRYGLVVGNTDKIDKKFFIHNEGFDFAYALNDLNSKIYVEELVDIIKNQINDAYTYLEILNKHYTSKNGKKIRSFVRNFEIRTY